MQMIASESGGRFGILGTGVGPPARAREADSTTTSDDGTIDLKRRGMMMGDGG